MPEKPEYIHLNNKARSRSPASKRPVHSMSGSIALSSQSRSIRMTTQSAVHSPILQLKNANNESFQFRNHRVPSEGTYSKSNTGERSDRINYQGNLSIDIAKSIKHKENSPLIVRNDSQNRLMWANFSKSPSPNSKIVVNVNRGIGLQVINAKGPLNLLESAKVNSLNPQVTIPVNYSAENLLQSQATSESQILGESHKFNHNRSVFNSNVQYINVKKSIPSHHVLSPQHRNQSSQHQLFVSSVSQREKELLRKNKVLEKRVGQLHNEKQMLSLKMGEQRHKLIDELDHLRSVVRRYETTSNEQFKRVDDESQNQRQGNIDTNQNNRSQRRVSMRSEQAECNNQEDRVRTSRQDSSRQKTLRNNNSNASEGLRNASTNEESHLQQQIYSLQSANQQLQEAISQQKPQCQNLNKLVITLQGEVKEREQKIQGLVQQCHRLGQELQNMHDCFQQNTKQIQKNNTIIVKEYELQLTEIKHRLLEVEQGRIQIIQSQWCQELQSDQQLQKLNQILGKITNLEKKNQELQIATTILKVERDSALKNLQQRQQKLQILSETQAKAKVKLLETVRKNADTIQSLSEEKQQAFLTLQSYTEEINELRLMCERYAEKGSSMTSSGIQTENRERLSNSTYNYSTGDKNQKKRQQINQEQYQQENQQHKNLQQPHSCNRCREIAKTMSKLNAHLSGHK